jgi:uncharacterized protein (DUF952 family)
VILHICDAAEWERAQEAGEYRAPSLEIDGFIHCSTAGQVCDVANSLYFGRADLVILVIDPDLVPAEIEFEDLYDLGEEYPHVYGPLPIVAITGVTLLPPGPDGEFELPYELVGI